MLNFDKMASEVVNNGTRVSPRRFAPIDYIKISVLVFGISGLWISLNSIVLPIRLLDFVPLSMKNSYLGYMTFTGLVLAMVMQPIVGAISDRSGFRWGRRRPYILIGVLMALLFLPGIGLWATYAVVFATYCLMQISTNTAQGPFQGFIPDLVPEGKRGLASGVKSAFEILGGAGVTRLAAYFMDRYSSGGEEQWLWITLGTLFAILLVTLLITLLTVKEEPGIRRPAPPLFTSLIKSFKIDVKQSPGFVWFLVSRGLMVIPGIALQTYILYYLMDVVGATNPARIAADLTITVGAGLIVVVYFAARLSDRVGRKPVLYASGAIGSAGIVLLFFAKSYPQILASGALIGIAMGAFLGTGWALATDMVAKGEEARYLGLTNLAMAGGSALARLLGPVIDFFNTFSTNLGYSVMLLICFVCFVAGSLVLLKVKVVKQDYLTDAAS